MYTSFTDWESGIYLEHHGVKGMHWGVRRYQNKDGTLTSAGKARLAKHTASYLNPMHEDRKRGMTSERDKVGKAYVKDYWAAEQKGMPTDVPSETGKKIWDKYKNAYADATLKDLGFKVTEKARNDVKAILKSIDPSYEYGQNLDMTDEQRHAYYDRHRQMIHPKRTKMKKTAKQLLDTAVKVKQLFA